MASVVKFKAGCAYFEKTFISEEEVDCYFFSKYVTVLSAPNQKSSKYENERCRKSARVFNAVR